MKEEQPISLLKAMIFGISVSLIATGTLIAIASLLTLVIN